jgi:intracellular sulfur oxidation DsrE/DsrF family protein
MRPAPTGAVKRLKKSGEQRRKNMTKVDRRHLLGGLTVAAAGVAAVRTAQAAPPELQFKDLKKDTEIACVYHCDFNNPRRVSAMARNIGNHLSVYDFDPFKAKIVVVAHSKGVQAFMKDVEGTVWEKDKLDPTLFEKFQNLAKYGVEVYLCQITFKANKIDTAKIKDAPFIKMVPSGVATVAELQRKGYAYLKVG